MSIYNMSARHLAPQGGGFEPQRAFNWVLTLSALDSIPNAPANAVDMIRLAVEKVQFPRFGTQVITMRYLNENRKVAGGAIVQGNQIVVRDFVDQQVFNALNAWMEAVHSVGTGGIGYASSYKRTGSLQLLDTLGNTRGSIKCIGAWPSEFSADQLDYETDSGVVKVNLTLQVDKYNMGDIQALNSVTATGIEEVGSV